MLNSEYFDENKRTRSSIIICCFAIVLVRWFALRSTYYYRFSQVTKCAGSLKTKQKIKILNWASQGIILNNRDSFGVRRKREKSVYFVRQKILTSSNISLIAGRPERVWDRSESPSCLLQHLLYRFGYQEVLPFSRALQN